LYSNVFKPVGLTRAISSANWLKQKAFCLVLSFCCLGLISHSIKAQEDSERWFEIEVILYKDISDRGLNKESWDTDREFSLPDTLEDFLNPIEPVVEIELEQPVIDSNLSNFPETKEHSSDLSTSNIITNDITQKDSNQRENLNQDLIVKNEQLEVTKERPFILLDEQYLQLKNEAKNISVHPSFRLLAHFAWRQPVAGKSTAIPVRLAGGNDYQREFEFSGSKKLELPDELLSDALNESEEGVDDNTKPDLGITLQTKDSALGPDSIQTAATNREPNGDRQDVEDNHNEVQQFNRLPWVPEVDGSVLIYIYRNYLHMDADLVFRKPGQQEVDIFSLGNRFGSEDPFDFSRDSFQTSPLANKPEASSDNDGILQDNMLLDKNSSNTDTPQRSQQQFDWQFDSDFLNQESEKVFTERLFNYPLKQTRRMRSTELHYFDHPKIGMLVIIRAYEVEPSNTEEQPN
jgi:hypothetical protein